MHSTLRILAGVGLAVAFVLAWGFGIGWELQLGSDGVPRPGHLVFQLAWTAVGSLVLVTLATGLERHRASLERIAAAGRDQTWMGAVVVGAVAAAWLTHTVVFSGHALTDDEGAYQFMAQVLLSGGVSATPPADTLFHDRVFMILKGGRWHAMYFLGWPALLAPFEAMGASHLANPTYHGLTTGLVFLAGKRIGGSAAARVSGILWAFAPMNVLAAATLLSHTSCAFALCVALLGAVHARDYQGWTGLAVGAGTAVAFCIRPLSAIGIGLPLVIFWVWHATINGRQRAIQAAGFALPVVSLATLFFLVNQWQHGDPFQVGYQAYMTYAEGNGFRFSAWPKEGPTVQVANLRFDPQHILTNTPVGLWRFANALLGAPLILVLMFRRRLHTGTALLLASSVSFIVSHLFLAAPGIDLFGPTHMFELGLPILLLLGVQMAEAGSWGWLVAAILVVAPVPFLFRAMTLSELASRAGAVPALTDDLDHGIVFVPGWEWAPNCDLNRSHTYRFGREVSRPDLDGRIVWANHLDVGRDRRYASRHHQTRTAWLVTYDEATCAHGLVELHSKEAESEPPGRQYFLR